MKQNSLLTPLFKKIDKVIFGFEEIIEIEKKPEYIECDNDDEFDAQRSIN
ncbi:MAG TPA: hypothetical protein PK657_14095 [Legionella sp.]|nr:hypothetical protein [Legionella sp.]